MDEVFKDTYSDLISVVLPVYNVSDYLDKCILSVLEQTYSNLEIILIDDGSTDDSGSKCDYYLSVDSRVKVFHKKNGGLSDARNFGISKATGKYITCIDSDDYVDTDYIEYLYRLVISSETKMSICQHRVLVNDKLYVDYGKKGDEILLTKDCIERMLYHDVIDTSAWGKLYLSSLFDEVQYPKGKIFEDIATTYRLMLQCDKVAVGYESKYNYIMRNNSIVNGAFKVSKLDLLEMTDKMAFDVKKTYPELKNAVIRRQVYARFSTLNQLLNYKEQKLYNKTIIDFIKKHSWSVLFNAKAPIRDKVAIILLLINYKLYRKIWNSYKLKSYGG